MVIITPSKGGPDLDHLFLTEQLGPEHEAYEELCAKFKSSPQGKRIIAFHKQNALMHDDLPSMTHNQLDHVIRGEGVVYPGDYWDRIGKIMAIRAHRLELEKEKLRSMTKEEREAYLAGKDDESKNRKTKEQLRAEEDERRRLAQIERRAAAKTAFEQRMAEKLNARDIARAKSRAFLDAEAERRKGTANPVAARKFAEEQRRAEDAEIEEVNVADDADLLNVPGASESAPGDEGTVALGRDSQEEVIDSPGVDLGAFTESDRAKELGLLNRTQLREIMTTYEIADALTDSNENRVKKIIDFEFKDLAAAPLAADPAAGSDIPPAPTGQEQTPTIPLPF